MPFQPYNPLRAVQKTRRKLPHWQQAGATYFVTFRLADSLPVEARLRLSERIRLNPDESFAWIERYLDKGCGECLLSFSRNAEIVASTLGRFDEDRYLLGPFVVMPNHVHLIVRPLGSQTLTKIVHSWKSYASFKLRAASPNHSTIWQEESFDRVIRSRAELQRFDAYILENPTKANLVGGAYLLGRGSGVE